MIGKTNSVNIIEGTTTTTDKYLGLRPSYWPKVRLPSEVEGEFADLVLFVPLSFNPSKKEGMTFTATIEVKGTIYWGDGTSTVSESYLVATSHTYTINVADYSEKAQGWLYLLSINGLVAHYTSLTSGISVLEVSASRSPWYEWTDDSIEFYSTAEYSEDTFGINIKTCQSLQLLPEITLGKNITTLDFYETKLYAFPDLNKDITTVKMPTVYYGTDWNPNFFNHITESITFDNFITYPNVSSLPQNITVYTIGTNWSGLEKVSDLSNYTYKYTTNLTSSNGFSSQTLIKSPSITFSSGTSGKYLFYNQTRLYEATLDPTNIDVSSNNYFMSAFNGCYRLTYIHMPENSVKAAAKKFDLYYLRFDNTDVEPRDNTMTVSQYAWTEVAKALHDYSGEEAPPYTPTINFQPDAESFVNTLTINGVSATEYITNKGWTITYGY